MCITLKGFSQPYPPVSECVRSNPQHVRLTVHAGARFCFTVWTALQLQSILLQLIASLAIASPSFLEVPHGGDPYNLSQYAHMLLVLLQLLPHGYTVSGRVPDMVATAVLAVAYFSLTSDVVGIPPLGFLVCALATCAARCTDCSMLFVVTPAVMYMGTSMFLSSVSNGALVSMATVQAMCMQFLMPFGIIAMGKWVAEKHSDSFPFNLLPAAPEAGKQALK